MNMPVNSTSCPHCGAAVVSSPTTAPGDNVTCPKCGALFNAEPARRSRSSARRLLTVVLVLGILAAAGVGAYYLTPALSSSGVNVGRGDEDPLAFLPADCAAVMSVELEPLLSVPMGGFMAMRRINQNIPAHFQANCRKHTGIEFNEMFDRVC